MHRPTRGQALDFSIHNDEQEFDRRQLESRLSSKINIPAPPISASDDDSDYQHHQSSVEYPRHMASPMPYPDFPSFAHRDRDDEDGMGMGWSYRTGEDEDGVSPYGGETMSTMNHHASAVTLNAGLGGRGGRRGDVSMSGAEYDPDRPLNRIMAGVGRLSMLEDSKSKGATNNLTFEPLVVDSTAELDRILETGHAPNRSLQHPTPPMSRASSSTSSDTEPGSPQRPKLSDHLRALAFSPKRPRNGAMSPPLQASPLAKRTPNQTVSMLSDRSTNITPRPARRAAQAVEVRPSAPTPSSGASKFTRMARGITKEIAETQDASNRARRQAQEAQTKPAPRTRRGSDHSKNRVVLPDVTGLTAAVESPARLGKDYYPYKGTAAREAEARLLQTLSQVQQKLQRLNDENGISRRRVRELEMELEEAKLEVARERTRLLEKEDVILQQQKEMNKAKGKARAREQAESEDAMKRYQEAVEEKKALEALIQSLRSHLARLTTELASHTELLKELRELRETDVRTLREKTKDITRLRDEVERLEGEVEVLRGVVEEGLRERRATKEASMQQSQGDTGMSLDVDGADTDDEDNKVRRRRFNAIESLDSEDDSDSTYQLDSRSRPIDRTDQATLGTSTPHRVQFIEQSELDAINAEMEERRSDRSISMNLDESFNPMAGKAEESGLGPSFYVDRPATPPRSDSPRLRTSKTAPAAKQPTQAKQQSKTRADELRKASAGSSRRPSGGAKETPFPVIRGEQLERLFFSAPEHNPKTCTVCYRRRGSHSSRPRSSHRPHEDDDEGFDENSDDEDLRRPRSRDSRDARKVLDKLLADLKVPCSTEDIRKVALRAGLPPQTVAMRVIRELEDDFAHYKSVYCELADQYKDMDPVSDVARRNLLAKHLKEVVDILEEKGDQIASLSDLLSFKDKSRK